MKFFYSVTCPRDFTSIRGIRLPKVRKLPVILSHDEVALIRRPTEFAHAARIASPPDPFRWDHDWQATARPAMGIAASTDPASVERTIGTLPSRVVPIPAATIEVLRTMKYLAAYIFRVASGAKRTRR